MLDMSLYIQAALKSWNRKSGTIPIISSVLVRNDNVPLFEDEYGYLDYSWILDVVNGRRCMNTEPLVNRYIGRNNLSLNKEYRKDDYYEILKIIGDDIKAVGRLNATMARYYFNIGECVKARYYFRCANITLKNILYFMISFINPLRKYVCKKFVVFG